MPVLPLKHEINLWFTIPKTDDFSLSDIEKKELGKEILDIIGNNLISKNPNIDIDFDTTYGGWDYEDDKFGGYEFFFPVIATAYIDGRWVGSKGSYWTPGGWHFEPEDDGIDNIDEDGVINDLYNMKILGPLIDKDSINIDFREVGWDGDDVEDSWWD